MHTLVKKLEIKGTLTCLTGLHIGDSNDNIEIGGVDNPVVKKINGEPYIPGSSLKGKIRCLLQQAAGEADFSHPENGKSAICSLFGALEGKDKEKNPGNPSRLIVRDAYMTEASKKQLRDSAFTDMPYTEVKFENRIDRIKGVAEHPRQQERIPAGTKFEVNFIINVMVNKEKGESADEIEKAFLATFYDGISLLEKDYLGGSGSRGYGQVKFTLAPEEKVFPKN